MADKILCDKQDVVDIANSVRAKLGVTDKYYVSQLSEKIDEIETGSSVALQPSKALTVTSNGTVSITPDAPYDAMQKVDLTVNVAGSGGIQWVDPD